MERPILFTTPMVQSILDGRKTQTRRVMKIQPDGRGTRCTNVYFEDWHGRELKCPYGKIGDVLWVRETWSKTDSGHIIYRATNKGFNPIWKPSIFMPKEACRIRLEITNIRVERLQDISEEDAIAEGIGAGFQMNAGWPDYQHIKNGVCSLTQDTAEMSYASLWESINGNGSWSKNPWVWVIEFRIKDKQD
jgi:hypothetical protein